MYLRKLGPVLTRMAKGYPILGVIGPRQAGKTTLVRELFKDKLYVSLEDPDKLEFAREDPRRFLSRYGEGAVFDEVQKCPSLFSYLQTHVDGQKKMGAFVLTGSQQFGLLEQITQSLAGRIGLVTLLPFSLGEVPAQARKSLDEVLLKGFYPPLFDRDVSPASWHSSYVQTYLERDVRQIINIKDTAAFQRFIKLCASRSGQILDMASLSRDTGVSNNTTSSWLNVLEASFICFRLQPHFKNFNKRLVKRPKLYFYDSGLLCWLLGIRKAEQLAFHPMRGAIFESWVIGEFYKHFYSMGETPPLYFWRDNSGTEIDLIIDGGDGLVPVEIKSSHTVQKTFFQNITLWQKYAGAESKQAMCVYGGDENQERSGGINIYSWRDFPAV